MRAVRTSLPLLLVSLTLLAPASAERGAAGIGGCTADPSWGAPREALASQVLALVNAHRAALGLRRLDPSPTLTGAAVWKARHMAGFAYMGHDDPAPPVARSAGDRIAACGYRSGWGENIAYGFPSASTVVQAWLASPGHRSNIENRSFVATGVGAAVGRGTVFWAQDFGTYNDAGPARRPNQSAPSPRTTRVPAGLGLSRVMHRLRVHPHAGRRFGARVDVIKNTTGSHVTAGQVKCDARIGHRYLRVVVNAFKAGRAACAWRMPRWTRGHDLAARIRVRAGGTYGIRWFWRHVR